MVKFIPPFGFRSRVRVEQTTSQEIPDDTWTKIKYDIIFFDTLEEFNLEADYFTASQPGFYFVCIGIGYPFTDVVANAPVQVRVIASGREKYRKSNQTNIIDDFSVNVSGIVHLNAGGHIIGETRHGFGETATTWNNPSVTFLAVHQIS